MSQDADNHHFVDTFLHVAEHVDWDSLINDVLPDSNSGFHPIELNADEHAHSTHELKDNTESHTTDDSQSISHHEHDLKSIEANGFWETPAVASWPQFDPIQTPEGIIGTPESSMHHWQQQCSSDTCGVVSQLYGLEELTGQTFTQDQLCQEAADNGWYLPGEGTPMNHMGKLLELHGIEVVREHGCNFDHLRDELNDGHKVWVSVDLDEIRTPGMDQDDSLAASHGLPGQGVNHAVQVIGIDDKSDPDIPKIILNDPAVANGCAMMVPLGAFMNAWEDGRYSMVHTTDAIAPESGHASHYAENQVQNTDMSSLGSDGIATSHEPTLRGYYNADGTYHYQSDNTDRDPETGKLIRQY